MSFPNLAVYNNEFWLYFFLVGKGYPSCLTYLSSIGWATWAIQAAMKKLQAQATNFTGQSWSLPKSDFNVWLLSWESFLRIIDSTAMYGNRGWFSRMPM